MHDYSISTGCRSVTKWLNTTSMSSQHAMFRNAQWWPTSCIFSSAECCTWQGSIWCRSLHCHDSCTPPAQSLSTCEFWALLALYLWLSLQGTYVYLCANGLQKRVDLLSNLSVQRPQGNAFSYWHLARVLIKVAASAAPAPLLARIHCYLTQVWAKSGSSPFMCKHMQPVNPKGCLAKVMRSPLQHVPLQVACIVIDNHAGRCKQHTHHLAYSQWQQHDPCES